MGFTTGLTGGVTLTLGLAYLAVYTHQRTREHQAQVLRSQTRVLDSLLEPVVQPPPPSRSEIEAARRANLIDEAKDRWNAEVANAVRWAQRTDWGEMREGVEEGVSKAWRGVFGVGEEQQQQQSGAAEQVDKLKREVVASGEAVARETKSAWERAKEKATAAAEVRAAEAQAAAERRASEMKKAAERKAAEAESAAEETVRAGRQEGEGLLRRAQRAASVVGEKAGEKAKEVKEGVEKLARKGTVAASAASPVESPVERALRERYERRGDEVMSKSVKATLEERYLPTRAKDYSHLRGL